MTPPPRTWNHQHGTRAYRARPAAHGIIPRPHPARGTLPPTHAHTQDISARLARGRKARALALEAASRAAILARAGYAHLGVSTAEVRPSSGDILITWPPRTDCELVLNTSTATFKSWADGHVTETVLDRPLAVALMQAHHLDASDAADTPEALLAARRAAAVLAVPHERSGFRLGTTWAVNAMQRDGVIVEWTHPPSRGARLDYTKMLVTPRGVSFGPWRGRRPEYVVAQWVTEPGWAAELMAAFGMSAAAAETPATTALLNALAAEEDAVVTRVSDEEFAFLRAATAAIPPVLFLSPPLAALVVDALRRAEVSDRMEALIAERAATPYGPAWVPALDRARVRHSVAHIRSFLWMAGQVVAPAAEARLIGAAAVAAMVRGMPGYTGTLPDDTWRALLVAPSELRGVPPRSPVRALIRSAPLESLTRQLFWGVRETAIFTGAGGVYRRVDGGEVPEDLLEELTRPQHEHDAGLPVATPPTAAALERVYRTFVLSAPMGTGKTRAIIRYFTRCLALRDGMLDVAERRRVVQVTPRRAFSAWAAGALVEEGFDFKLYATVDGDLTHPRMVVQAESLHRMQAIRERDLPPHVLLLDEIAMILPQLCSAGTHGDKHTDNVDVFMWLVRHARIVIAADAFMTPAVLAMLRFLRGGTAHEPDAVAAVLPGAFFIQVAQRPDLGLAREVASFDHLVSAISRTLMEWRLYKGRLVICRAACFVTSAVKATQLAEWFKLNDVPGAAYHEARRARFAALAGEAGMAPAGAALAAWVDANFRPLRVRLDIGGRRDAPTEMADVSTAWGAAATDVVVVTTTAACGVSFVGGGSNSIERAFFYGCAGSDVCRVQAQLVRRVRNPRQRGLTYCLEARASRPPARGIADVTAHLAQRVVTVTGIVGPAAPATRYPLFMQHVAAETENEAAVCRYSFCDVMQRYLELAGFTFIPEAADDDAPRAAPVPPRELPPLADVPKPIPPGVEEEVALFSLRATEAAGFRLEYDEQLWVTASDFAGSLGTDAEAAAMWPFAVDPQSARFVRPFREARNAVRDPTRAAALLHWVATRFIDTVPASMPAAWGCARLDAVLAECGAPAAGGPTLEIAPDVFKAFMTWLAGHDAEVKRLTSALNMRPPGRAVPGPKFGIALIRAAWGAVRGARVRVAAAGQETVYDPLLPWSKRRRVRRRAVHIDWRPWWRATALMTARATLHADPPADLPGGAAAWWAEVAAAWSKRPPADDDDGEGGEDGGEGGEGGGGGGGVPATTGVEYAGALDGDADEPPSPPPAQRPRLNVIPDDSEDVLLFESQL